MTVEVICHTVGWRSTSNSDGTCTEPTSATRPRSLRSMSTIIMFPACSFSEMRNSSARVRSSALDLPLGAVPFIGRAVTCRPT